MPMRNRFNRSLQMKFEISELDHEIQQLQVDLDYSKKQGLLIRQAIKEKEQQMQEMCRRFDRHEVRGERHDSI